MHFIAWVENINLLMDRVGEEAEAHANAEKEIISGGAAADKDRTGGSNSVFDEVPAQPNNAPG